MTADELEERTYRCSRCHETYQDNVPSLIGWCPVCEHLTARHPC